MLIKKHNRYRPLYRKFLLYRGNAQNRFKFRSLKRKLNKKKWDTFYFHLSKLKKRYRRYKSHDQSLFKLSKYAGGMNSLKKFFKKCLHTSKRFSLFYGGLNKRYVKTKIKLVLNKKKRDSSADKNINLNILKFFESRLDSVIYRSHFSLSMRNARQIIAHGHVYVNKRINTNYSYTLKNGDLIEIKPESYKLIKKNLRRIIFWPIPPKYLHINYLTIQIIFGKIENSYLMHSFPFWLDIYTVAHHYYRH
jgi:ribosomal protein S4